MEKTIIDLLNSAAKRFGGKTIYEDDTKGLSFNEVQQLANKVATSVANLSEPNKPIVVWADKSIRVPSMYIGVLGAGCFYVPLGPDVPVVRVKTIIEIVGAKVLLTDGMSDELLTQLEFAGKTLKLDDCIKIDQKLISIRQQNIVDTDPQYVIFTSGSTGKPKGVITSHRSVVDYVTTFIETFNITNEDIFGNQAPLEYIAGIRDMFIPLCVGSKTVITPKEYFSNPVKLFEYINNKKVTVICWVSSAFTLIHDLDTFKEIKPQYLKKLFFTGSTMLPKIFYYLRDSLPDVMLCNHYGPTEITASCTYYITSATENYDSGIPIGVAFKNRKVFLLDEKGKAVPDGEKGEICVSGACLAIGYFSNPEKTSEVFIKNPLQSNYPEIIYKTGDIGQIRSDGIMLFHGRKDNQIKHMGHRIELGEIEVVASSCKDIGANVCIYDEVKGAICLFYTGSATSRDLAIELRSKLPSFMIPRKFIKLESFPKMFNGKIDMQQLKRDIAK